MPFKRPPEVVIQDHKRNYVVDYDGKRGSRSSRGSSMTETPSTTPNLVSQSAPASTIAPALHGTPSPSAVSMANPVLPAQLTLAETGVMSPKPMVTPSEADHPDIHDKMTLSSAAGSNPNTSHLLPEPSTTPLLQAREAAPSTATAFAVMNSSGLSQPGQDPRVSVGSIPSAPSSPLSPVRNTGVASPRVPTATEKRISLSKGNTSLLNRISGKGEADLRAELQSWIEEHQKMAEELENKTRQVAEMEDFTSSLSKAAEQLESRMSQAERRFADMMSEKNAQIDRERGNYNERISDLRKKLSMAERTDVSSYDDAALAHEVAEQARKEASELRKALENERAMSAKREEGMRAELEDMKARVLSGDGSLVVVEKNKEVESARRTIRSLSTRCAELEDELSKSKAGPESDRSDEGRRLELAEQMSQRLAADLEKSLTKIRSLLVEREDWSREKMEMSRRIERLEDEQSQNAAERQQERQAFEAAMKDMEEVGASNLEQLMQIRHQGNGMVSSLEQENKRLADHVRSLEEAHEYTKQEWKRSMEAVTSQLRQAKAGQVDVNEVRQLRGDRDSFAAEAEKLRMTNRALEEEFKNELLYWREKAERRKQKTRSLKEMIEMGEPVGGLYNSVTFGSNTTFDSRQRPVSGGTARGLSSGSRVTRAATKQSGRPKTQRPHSLHRL